MKPIEIEELSKTFRGKKGRRVEALKGVSLSVAEGEVFGFLGPNGAGKSTLIKALLGQIRPSGGVARLFGRPTGTAEARVCVGYLPENPSFYDFLTAREYLDLVGRAFGLPPAVLRRESEQVLETMSLTEAANRPIRGYSKGMVQRLGLAQTLFHDPDLFILDEPMSGLDPVGRALVKEIILDLKKKGKTVFFSTHVIADVEAVCDHVAIIAAGTLQAIHDVEQVLQSGIEGYTVRVGGVSPGAMSEFIVTEISEGRIDASVPREHFQEFMEQLFICGGHVLLIEPQRRSLEALFLEIVGRTS
ncbi:ABC transporter ATP-binding protein [Desulfuromonas sp. TF]|uniref:ABC transporter ATP-binding protein n=1 Tax=Desulfuromonas sp. TF TaxID=1232410 RepID=UPI0004106F96|nr:ABC transporter ATP-binding protein [Desulfuromonas sp. TF]